MNYNSPPHKATYHSQPTNTISRNIFSHDVYFHLNLELKPSYSSCQAQSLTRETKFPRYIFGHDLFLDLHITMLPRTPCFPILQLITHLHSRMSVDPSNTGITILKQVERRASAKRFPRTQGKKETGECSCFWKAIYKFVASCSEG